MSRELLYIASPLRGDVEKNIENAMRYCAKAVEQGYIPIAPHAMYRGMFNDEIPEQRQAALDIGLQLLEKCSKAWVCGDRISEGMRGEIELARRQGKEVEYLPEAFFTGQKPSRSLSPNALRQEAANALEQGKQSAEGIWGLLSLKARFPAHSLESAEAIQRQNPRARFVAPSQEWAKRGYRVTDREGILLMIPVQTASFERGGEKLPLSQATPEERAGMLEGRVPVEEHTGYRASMVFDIAQTSCPKEDYEKVMGNPYLHLTHGELYDCLKSTVEQCGFEIAESSHPALEAPGAGGYLSPEGQIVVSGRIHPSQKLAALADVFSKALVEQSSGQPSPGQAFEAEALSFLLRSRLGVPENLPGRGGQLSCQEIAGKPELFDRCMERVQKMLDFSEAHLGETIREAGLEFEPEQTAKKDQKLSQSQREINRNFTQDID